MSKHLTDEEKRPSQAEAGRTLLAAADDAVLATIDSEDYPYASVVEYIPTDDGDIVLFLSDLASHTQNAKSNDRASVVISESATIGQVLALGRVSCQGRIAVVDDRELYRDAYLERHPQASGYIDFSDFNFYRLEVERARYIGGFGRMSWIERDEWTTAEVDPLVGGAADVIEHMNDDHAHNILDYVHAFTDRDWAESATMIRLDRLGFDVRAENDERSEEIRMTFRSPRETHESIHSVMVHLARDARKVLDEPAE